MKSGKSGKKAVRKASPASPARPEPPGALPSLVAGSGGTGTSLAGAANSAKKAKEKKNQDKDKERRKSASKEAGKSKDAVRAKSVADADSGREHKRIKLIRDSFTMPEPDYALIAALKAQALAAGVELKKSELLRAGLAMLSKLPSRDLLERMAALPRLKTGRPQKKKK